MTASEQEIEENAKSFARTNKKEIALRWTDSTKYPPEKTPVSVFMAGSPGAGKTEASISLLRQLRDGHETLRVDPDELRSELPGYNGKNSWLFNGAISILVDRIHDFALKNKQSFLLDGTLSHYEIAHLNIQRSLKRDRFVQILYVYQDPYLAWRFVQAREKVEGRRVPRNRFIEQYFAARNVVNRLKLEFEAQIQIDLLLKNNDASTKVYKANIDNIDHHVPEKHTKDELENSLIVL